jgi:TRAP-type C4-dicarboxylate transport system permease small subunit
MQRLVNRLAEVSALLGGIVLTALIVLTSISITGRAFTWAGLGPVPGDFELVEAGIAFAVFAFLPLCQIRVGHATVDLIAGALSQRMNRGLVAFWEGVSLLVFLVIVWRLFVGFEAKLKNGETTLMLQFPVWWAYALCLIPAAALVMATLWSAWDRLRACATGRDTRPVTGEALH